MVALATSGVWETAKTALGKALIRLRARRREITGDHNTSLSTGLKCRQFRRTLNGRKSLIPLCCRVETT